MVGVLIFVKIFFKEGGCFCLFVLRLLLLVVIVVRLGKEEIFFKGFLGYVFIVEVIIDMDSEVIENSLVIRDLFFGVGGGYIFLVYSNGEDRYGNN